MNKILKISLVILNLLMLGIAISWYIDQKEYEPLIVITGQIATILGLIFENKVSKIITKGIKNNSDVDVDVVSGDNVKTSDIDNSKIRVKTKN